MKIRLARKEDARGKRLGSKLYDTLENVLYRQGFVHCLVCISLPNGASLAFHKKGYQHIAHLPNIGYTFACWHDVVWLQKSLDKPAHPLKLITEMEIDK